MRLRTAVAAGLLVAWAGLLTPGIAWAQDEAESEGPSAGPQGGAPDPGEPRGGPHGGAMRATARELTLEMSLEGETLKIYPMTRDLKAVPMKDVKLSASYSSGGGPSRKVAFKRVGDHFEGKLKPAAGARTYKLEIETRYRGSRERAVFELPVR